MLEIEIYDGGGLLVRVLLIDDPRYSIVAEFNKDRNDDLIAVVPQE